VSESLRSRLYARVQTALLVAFAAAAFFGRTPLLFSSNSLRSAGVALCGLGLLLMAFAFISLRRVIQIAPEPRSSGHLVTSGVYRWLRHPIYTGMLIIIVGLFIRRPTLVLAIASVVVIAFLLAKTRFEEELLVVKYPEYADYRRRTWGIIPGLR
jgi:protein-S-isoprenylcysteine O-methyltransferase Ste14